MKRLLVTIVVAGLCLAMHAETKEHVLNHKHEIRVGLGESILWSLENGVGLVGPAMRYQWNDCWFMGMSVEDMDKYLSTQEDLPVYDNFHCFVPVVFAEYVYRVNSWFGAGVQTNFWTQDMRQSTYNLYGDRLKREYMSILDWSTLAVARFTYDHGEWVSLYSHVGVGVSLGVAMTDMKVTKAVPSVVFSATLLGVSVGRDHWFGTFELGGMLPYPLEYYPGKLFSVSCGYRL